MPYLSLDTCYMCLYRYAVISSAYCIFMLIYYLFVTFNILIVIQNSQSADLS